VTYNVFPVFLSTVVSGTPPDEEADDDEEEDAAGFFAAEVEGVAGDGLDVMGSEMGFEEGSSFGGGAVSGVECLMGGDFIAEAEGGWGGGERMIGGECDDPESLC